jgi:GTP-binding protein
MIFVDEARIFVKSGDGGKGCESYYRDSRTRYPRADGGDGGKGGDVVVIADRNIQTLLDFKYKQHYHAGRGGHGSSKGKAGKNGETCVLRVPVGTILRDHATGLLIKDLVHDRQSVVIVKGARGGVGNGRRKIPLPPQKGQEVTLVLELKLIADVGIVGFPNAGKSTLITGLSKAQSKIASYPFTTRQPILGIVHCEDFGFPSAERCREFIVADLPGIIEGAHRGKGLGDRFLRHAERTKILMHVVDMAGSEGRDPLEDYAKLDHELKSYSEEFVFKQRIIVANKMDLPGAASHLKRFKKKYQGKVIPVSALKKEGLTGLVSFIKDILCQENSRDPSNGLS